MKVRHLVEGGTQKRTDGIRLTALSRYRGTSSPIRLLSGPDQKLARKNGISSALARSIKNAHTSGTTINATWEAP